MTRTEKNVLAILAAPSATTLMIVASGLLHARLDLADRTTELVVLAVLGGSYAISYTLGIPVYLFARRRDWRRAREYMGGAFLMGLAAVPVIIALLFVRVGMLRPEAFVPAASDLWNHRVLFLLIGSIGIGCLSVPIGLMFWLIVRPDRPV